MSITLPESSKLTLKGNVPEKLEAKGVDPSSLHNFTTSFSEDVHKAVEKALTPVMEKVLADSVNKTKTKDGTTYDKVFEAVNGKGYNANWLKQAVSDATKELLGTAVQGRAFKQTLVDNTEGLDMSDFESTAKKGKATAVKANPFG